ncbi:hypothetical protein [Lagierella sp.]|uniref:hypothetical protein n=1 Tax=Lagierella sp. TaxID=2849657 RepID=UPI00261C4845|nr:hypothetical protein [Lagierella sp.]
MLIGCDKKSSVDKPTAEIGNNRIISENKIEFKFNFIGADMGYIGMGVYYDGSEKDLKELISELDKVKKDGSYEAKFNIELVYENLILSFDPPKDKEKLYINYDEYDKGEKETYIIEANPGDKSYESMMNIYEKALKDNGLSPEAIEKAYDENFSLNNLK